MKYTSISLYQKMIDHALVEGLTPADFHDLPISLNQLKDVRAVPADHFFALHERLDESLGPGFALRVGQQMKMDDYGVLGLSWKTCSWAGEIFDRSERYFKLLSNTYVFQVEKGRVDSRVYLHRDAYRRGVELSNEATFSATVVVLQAITQTSITPIEVAFKHPAPTALAIYQQTFNCPVLFGQDHNYITYTTADLNTRTATADDSINKFLLERVEEEQKGIAQSSIKIAADVAALITARLPSGIPGVGEVGEHMGMSSRTLTRRLAENGIQYRELVKQTQEKIARQLLQDSSQTISEIAFQTGFSEQSAFSRAFKRWTGQSPQNYRSTPT